MFASKDIFLKSSGNYQISRSVRLRSSASAYFNRTLTTPTNNKIWTWSGWVKRGKLGSAQAIIGTTDNNTASGNFGALRFNASDYLEYYEYASAYTLQISSNGVYRDPSAWYHIVVAIDTTQATAANRTKFYVNGVAVAMSLTTSPALNYNTFINSAVATYQGAYNNSGTGVLALFDGYMTEINFIDGQALTPSSFGETDALTGVWKPKKYAGTYGTNGFYLNFSDNSSNTATTIGKDYSGNGNNWTPNNISVTAGVTYDSMIDVPTMYADGGNGRGNYSVLNPLKNALTLSAANLNWVGISSGTKNAFSSIAPNSGKWYFEALLTNTSISGNWGIGLCNDLNASTTTAIWNSLTGWALITGSGGANLTKYHNSSSTTIYSAASSIGAVIGVAFDIDAGKIWFSRNGTWLEGDPSSGTTPSYSDLSGTVQVVAYGYDANDQGSVNFGQRPFTYTPPTGFVALNTQNLPAPTISNGANYMAATTYTGTGSAQNISNAVGGVSFQPDLVWVKARSSAYSHRLANVITGATNYLDTAQTAAEFTDAGNSVSSFNSGGFGVGTYVSANNNGTTYVGWQWKAGGTAVSNTSGSITSTVSAGATQGFSVVTWTGSGAAATVGHGLGVAPKMVIIKNRTTAASWPVYHASIGNTAAVFLNATNASTTSSTYFNNTSPTSSVFSVESATATNGSTNSMVAYCFAEVAGYSKFGSYTGNGSADGPFVFCGFRPRFIMIKRTDSAGNNWVILDTSRDTYNAAGLYLYPNLSAAEDDYRASTGPVDILSNGFKQRSTLTNVNASGGTYIFMAVAENPFKLSLAR